jgi:hypothetical protein
MRVWLAPLLAVAILAAGCSAGEPSAFTAEPTAKCLKGQGYHDVTTDDAKVGVVAANAAHGGLRAYEPGNALTIAFAENSDDALQTKAGFIRFAPKKLQKHIDDVLRIQKNAVMLWTVTPPQQEMNTVYGCLKG